MTDEERGRRKKCEFYNRSSFFAEVPWRPMTVMTTAAGTVRRHGR